MQFQVLSYLRFVYIQYREKPMVSDLFNSLVELS